MSWTRIWIHLVFSTKNREKFLTNDIRNKVFEHILENAEKKKIYTDTVNGYNDHCHCLIGLGREQCISKVTQLIKGESSHWINEQKWCYENFLWQDDYWAVSVSESHVKRVREYIRNQEIHHAKKSFDKEIDEFKRKYGWEKMKD